MDGRISNFRQIASITRYEITEGREKGIEVIDCDNGKLRFLLNVRKALDMMQIYHEGQNVSFLSKNAFTAREAAFSKRFEGGALYTCGLDSAGAREGYEVHGSFHNNRATVTRSECDEKGIIVEAYVRDAELFGKNLLLKRTVKSGIFADTVEISDELINEGFCDEEYCVLYHVNVGYPMLDKDCTLEFEAESVLPRTQRAKERADDIGSFGAPIDGDEETCYFLTLPSRSIRVVNPKIRKRFDLLYDGEDLTEFVLWKSRASGDYALGIEPSTTKLDDHFKYKTIRSGENKKNKIKISISSY